MCGVRTDGEEPGQDPFHVLLFYQAFDGINKFCGEFQPLSAEDPAHPPPCGSKRLELSFKNTIPLQLIFLYHGFEDAFDRLTSISVIKGED